MIMTKNPVYSLKFLILVFLNFGFLLIYQDLIYLGLIFIMVYVGAVTILFLFVVMMLDIRYNVSDTFNYITVGLMFSFLFSALTFTIINFNSENIYSIEIAINTNYTTLNIYSYSLLNVLGILMFNYYAPAIIIVGVLLLGVTISAIHLTHDTDAMPVRKQSFQTSSNSTFFYTIYTHS